MAETIKAKTSLAASESVSKIYGLTNQNEVIEAPLTQVGAPNNAPNFPNVLGVGANGQFIKTPLASFQDNLNTLDEATGYEPVMILYNYEVSWGVPNRLATIQDWKEIKKNPDHFSNSHVQGILLCDGKEPLVIAIDEIKAPTWGSSACRYLDWSPGMDSVFRYGTEEGQLAMAKIAAATDPDNYINNTQCAIGYAYNYSTPIDIAHAWRLPTPGELLRIRANIAKINAALDAVGGIQLSSANYWSCIETAMNNVYIIGFENYKGSSNPIADWHNIATSGKTQNASSPGVRPVKSGFGYKTKLN